MNTATHKISTLSLHDALPIYLDCRLIPNVIVLPATAALLVAQIALYPHHEQGRGGDRKSTRLNSSHVEISYAVFCLKKKKMINISATTQNAIALETASGSSA